MTGEEFRSCRKAIPMTTEELAAWLGVTRMTVFRYEKNRSPVPDAIARAMQDAAPITDEAMALMDRSA